MASALSFPNSRHHPHPPTPLPLPHRAQHKIRQDGDRASDPQCLLRPRLASPAARSRDSCRHQDMLARGRGTSRPHLLGRCICIRICCDPTSVLTLLLLLRVKAVEDARTPAEDGHIWRPEADLSWSGQVWMPLRLWWWAGIYERPYLCWSGYVCLPEAALPATPHPCAPGGGLGHYMNGLQNPIVLFLTSVVAGRTSAGADTFGCQKQLCLLLLAPAPLMVD